MRGECFGERGGERAGARGEFGGEGQEGVYDDDDEGEILSSPFVKKREVEVSIFFRKTRGAGSLLPLTVPFPLLYI